MNKWYLSVFLVGLSLSLSGCSRDLSDLESYVSKVKARKAGAIEPLPVITDHPKYTYRSSLLRSPFLPDIEAEKSSEKKRIQNGPKRDENRNKEFLEDFPLDSLQMVGTLNSKGTNFALIKTADGLLHQVRAGNYMGQNDGQVTKVTESGLEVREIVPDGLGGYVYRPSELPLEENI